MRHSIDIVCPSRSSKQQTFFINRMIKSVKQNSHFELVDLRFLICLDNECSISLPNHDVDIIVVNSDGYSQAKALNAGLRNSTSDFIAIIEDDDQWNRDFLKTAIKAFETRELDFISSNQIEVGMNGNIIRINDFPTPSGWVFRKKVIEQVGYFSEDFKWHLDNEFLGKINKSKIRRGHLIEKYAPIDINLARQVRPWIANIYDSCRGNIEFLRHQNHEPLIVRQVHPESGMYRIARDKKLKEEADIETIKLRNMYGNVPW